ncbi:ABC transporter permease YtrF precursor [bacterium BMS3Abin10]|nr:ABC transporter permease YtrF precursor [bacterium BMS3Abin10]GBE38153.1 ABC transporter permease YtrF precursor [bacterium BMS3Bbin08]HDH49999.1 ABC transporter permease [Nitrospirota bacterium]
MNILKLIKFSFRNLFRNRRRTLITLLVTASGFAALALVSGYISFTLHGLQALTIRNGFTGSGGTGHMQIFNQHSLEEEELYPLQFGINDHKAVEQDIADIDGVSFVMSRIDFSGLISTGEKSVSFLGMGIDPEKEADLLSPLVKHKSMEFENEALFNLKKTPNGVILGKGLASSLRADIGSYLMLISTTVDGAVNAVDVSVAGVISTGLKTVDRYYLLTHIPTVQRLIQTDRVSKLVVVLDETEDLPIIKPKVLETVNKYVPSQTLAVIEWQDLAGYYHSILDLYNIIFNFLGFIVVIIVMLSCVNTMLMATMERIKEIGTLKAIGISGRWITFVFLLEGLFIGIGSVFIGLVLHYVAAFIINSSMITMPPPPGMNISYTLEVYATTRYLPLIALLIISSTTFSSMLTLRKVRKISIVDALNYV